MRNPILLKSVILPGLVVMLAGFAGISLSTFAQYQLTQIMIACLTGVALVMIVGYARVIMLATSAMMAIGAYGSVILMLEMGIPYVLTLPICLIFGLVSGAVLGLPATRFRGHHLAMVTLVFQYLVVISIREGGALTGGALGLTVPDLNAFGARPSNDTDWMLFIAFATSFSIILLAVFLTARFGKILKAISDAEVAADAYGINLARYKIAAFAISSAFLSLAGALMAPGVRVLDPTSFDIHHSIVALGYPIVGGMGSLWGGLIGASVLRSLPEFLRFLGEYLDFWVALLAIVVMMVNPGGILGILSSMRPQLKVKDVITEPSHVRASGAPTSSRGSAGAIVVKNGTKAYEGLIAVNNVELVVRAGEIHGLIGPNGAGKTTLFNAISGFAPLDSGTIEIFGRDIGKQPSRERIQHGVTRTFQHVEVFSHLSCLDNVILGLGRNSVLNALKFSVGDAVSSSASREQSGQAMEALSEVGLAELAGQRAGSLSLGNQRRLEIARAIASKPKLLLLDEPVSGVAQEEEQRIANLLARLNADHGITMLLIEHNIAFVRRLAGEMSVMASGEIIANGDPEAVIAMPSVRQTYFGERHVTASA